MIVWSYGGGTQSIAIALLISQGKLPVPDRIVMADTGGEMTEVWDYQHAYIDPLLATVDRKIEIAPHSLANVDFYSKEGDLLIPAFTQTGKLSTFCSKEWKALVVRRYLGGHKTIGNIIMWLGMSTDEVWRMKPADKKWIEHQWPLCDMPVKAGYGIRMNREQCRKFIMNAGYPDPPHSACVWCPHLDNAQWQRMKNYAPQDFERAKQVQLQIYNADKQGGVWLHRELKPLEEIDFTREPQPLLFEDDDCRSGYCHC